MAKELGNSSSYPESEYIDLVDILVKLVRIVQRRLIWLFVFFIIGAGFGTVGYFTFEPVYTTRMLVESDVVSYGDVSSLMENLQELVDEKNYPLIAQKLKLNEDQASNFSDIEVINITEKEIGRTEKENILDYRYIIQVQVNKTDILGKLQKGIIEYLENNEYIQERTANRKEVLELSIQKIQADVAQIDSIKKSIQVLIASNDRQNLFLPDLGKLYEQGVELYEKELDFRSRLRFVDQFQVMEGFTEYQTPSSFNLIKSILVGCITGFFIWIVLVIYLELRLVVQQAIQNRQEA